MNHFWIGLAISFNEKFTYNQPIIYLSGVLVAGFIGYRCLVRLRRMEGSIGLHQFHGHSYQHPKIALYFFFVVGSDWISDYAYLYWRRFDLYAHS